MKWTEGQDLKELKFPPITRSQLAAYAEASGDRNPIHLDEDFAKAAGFPSVIVHGMLSMAFMADHLRFNFPEREFKVVRLKTRFRKVTLPGDELVCSGTIKRVPENGKFTVAICAKNQKGEVTAESEAVVAIH